MEHKKEKIDFKYNLKEYFQFLANYKWKVILLILIVILVELLFVLDKFLFKRLVDDGELFISGSLPLEIFVKTLIILGAIFIGIVVFRSIGRWLSEHVLINFETQMIKDLKMKYFKHLLRLSHEFHTTHKSGTLISRINRGASSIEGLTDTFIFQLFPLIIQLILVSISLILFAPFAIIALSIISLSFIFLSFILQKAAESSQLEKVSADDKEKGFISDVFTNIDSIKYFGKESTIQRKFDIFITKTKNWQLKNYKYYRWIFSVQFLILGIGTFFLVYFPIQDFIAGKITLGTLVFVYSLYGNIAGNLFSFVWGIKNFYKTMGDMQDLFKYGKIQNSIKDTPSAKKISIKKGEIEFKHIKFDYGKRHLFKDFNLKIKPNEKIAFVGHSGSGKTTLIKLLKRFYDVNEGGIFIDGENIKEFKQESLREEIGIVPQECILFDDTIYNNIKFANNATTKEQVLDAIKFAQLDQLIKKFPDKENTIVGERGVKLSGGEKQRVSIARAILANKKILILDEATSALDSETEYEIQKDLQKLLEGRTAIMIAHRLSTIMKADRIIVMKNGEIVQEGKHQDLIRREGEYKKLWNLQKGGYIH